MTPHSILAVTDFSRTGDLALARAALLCAQHDATLKLVHLAPPGQHAPPDAVCRLVHHALQLTQRHDIRARASTRIASHVEDMLGETSTADLVVWGPEPASGLRAFLAGPPLEAVVRKGRRPVLVVQKPVDHAYRRVVVGIGFSPSSHRLVELAAALNPTARLELFHAVSMAGEARLRYADVSARAIEVYRQACRQHAQDRMVSLVDSYDARRNRVMSTLGQGDAPCQLHAQQQLAGADLVVVSRHPASRLSHVLFESVAQRVLRRVETDVLVVPRDFQASSAALASRRLAPVLPVVRRVRAGAPKPPGRIDGSSRPSPPMRNLRPSAQVLE